MTARLALAARFGVNGLVVLLLALSATSLMAQATSQEKSKPIVSVSQPTQEESHRQTVQRQFLKDYLRQGSSKRLDDNKAEREADSPFLDEFEGLDSSAPIFRQPNLPLADRTNRQRNDIQILKQRAAPKSFTNQIAFSEFPVTETGAEPEPVTAASTELSTQQTTGESETVPRTGFAPTTDSVESSYSSGTVHIVTVDPRYLSSSQQPGLRPAPRPCRAASCNCAQCVQARSSRRGFFSRRWHGRIKPRLQDSHWGYCNYFQKRPFGDSVLSTISRQVQRGSADTMMLYRYDFLPAASGHGTALTKRGRYQLRKIVQRLEFTPAPIQVELSANGSLDEARRKQVVREIANLGVEDSDGRVVLARRGYGVPGSEARETANGLLQNVQSRGRTLKAGGSTSFGSAGTGN